MFTADDVHWMNHALSLAKQAGQDNEVPIGALVVAENVLIGEGWNQTLKHCDPTAHAEVLALRAAAKKQHNHRLLNTTVYVTVEPCAMCVGAMLQARVKRLVYGALEPRFGAVASQFHLLDSKTLTHQITWEGGCEANVCADLLKKFFQIKRSLL